MTNNNGKIFIPALVGTAIALIFSLFLMFHTFSYDVRTQSMKISSKLWSDFGAHVPLIRSFSHGPNLGRLMRGQPVESPLFPGEPIRYHFGFYALAGLLEKIGLRIDWAVNLPSALGFFALLLSIWTLSFLLFKSNVISLVSVLFFLCNGSLSFIRFFTDHPVSIRTISDIVSNNRFVSFGPWDGGVISAFWTLNIYTNQRHLALAYALVLAIVAISMNTETKNTPKNKMAIVLLVSFFLSILLFINYAAVAIAALFLAWFFLRIPKNRTSLFLIGLCSLLAFFILRHSANLATQIAFSPGYLIRTALTVPTFLTYWWHNIGLHSILIPVGFLLAPRTVRRSFGVPLIVLFVLPNIFRFSPDMINNHKFFNFFMIVGSMFSALALVRIFTIRKIGTLVGSVMFILLILSGVIDLFPVINDHKGMVNDTAANPDIQFFANNVPPGATVANTTWFYHPASLAGRSLYSGYTYFTWSYGYDQVQREQNLIEIYEAQTLERMCMLLRKHHVSYVELSQTPEEYLRPNYALWNQLTADYTNAKRGIAVYSSDTICRTNGPEGTDPL